MQKSTDIFGSLLSPLGERDESGLSAVEKLMRTFEAHEAEEKGFLDSYRAIVEECKDPMAAFLLNLIIRDEERHEAVVHAMAATIKGSLNWTEPAAALHGISQLDEEESRRLLPLTEEFIKEEKKSIKEYKKLVKTASDYYGGIFVLLLKTMLHDSEKHVMILEFLREKLRLSSQEARPMIQPG